MFQGMINTMPGVDAEPRFAEKPVTFDADLNVTFHFATPEGRNMVQRMAGGDPGENNTLVFTRERMEVLGRELIEEMRQEKGMRESGKKGSMFGGK
jgi:hypothetical protein